MRKKVYIGLGTNLGDKESNLSHAYKEIENRVGKIVRRSSHYKTEPWGFETENEFINSVILIETDLSPTALLDQLQQIEKYLGRKNKTTDHYESRIIDLDILDYMGQIIDFDELQLPHPEMQKRDFVLVPLAELDPEWRHPILNKTARELSEVLSVEFKVIKIS